MSLILQVYEGIIQELRYEIDNLSSRYHDASQRLEHANTRAAKVQQLEEEVKMYR